MRSPDAKIDRIAMLLQQGLDHYGRNDIDRAIDCWREVLELDPSQAEARDYLESAGFAIAPRLPMEDSEIEASRPESSGATPELERLLRDRRYEEALKVLYAARAQSPKDQAISRSIRLLRERIAVDYAARLVNLDRVPLRGERVASGTLSGEERQVFSLVDGISSYGDIVAASAMGRLNTLRILCGFLDQGLITASTPSAAPPHARSGAHVRPRFSAQEQAPPTVPSSQSPSGVRPSSPPPARRSSPPPARDSAPPPARDSAPPPPFASRDSAPPPPLYRADTRSLNDLAAETYGAPPVTPRSSGGLMSGQGYLGQPFSGPSYTAQSSDAILPPSSRPSRPPRAPEIDDGFQALFAQATEAYLVRDYARAFDLFTQCAQLRPEDRRVLHNLKALQKRLDL
jgi:tetratricopeptide (TPR) repeat protein